MARTVALPKLEAKFQVRPKWQLDAEWRDSLDLDPVMIPVESDGCTDVFDRYVMDLVDMLTNAAVLDHQTWEYRLVWSVAGTDVKGLCPACDDTFPIAEGGNADQWNEGYDAVWCGCDPRDSFNG